MITGGRMCWRCRAFTAAGATVALLASGPVSAEPGPPVTVGLRLQLKADGRANPLTNELDYLPLAVEVGAALRPWLSVHGGLGLGLVVGDETRGRTVEAVVGATVGTARDRWWLGGRLDVGYAYTFITFDDEDAATHGSLVEAGVQLGRAVGRRGRLSLLAGPRLHGLHRIRIATAVSDESRWETRWDTGYHLGALYERGW